MAEKEANLMKKLDHINIVKVIETFSAEDNFFILLEYANDGDLRGFIRQRKNTEKDEK